MPLEEEVALEVESLLDASAEDTTSCMETEEVKSEDVEIPVWSGSNVNETNDEEAIWLGLMDAVAELISEETSSIVDSIDSEELPGTDDSVDIEELSAGTEDAMGVISDADEAAGVDDITIVEDATDDGEAEI